MKYRAIGTVFLVLATVGAAQAGSYTPSYRAGQWDFSLQTRYTASKDIKGEGGSSLSLSDDLGWGFGFGYNLNNQVNLGFSFAWRSIPYSAKIIDAEDAGASSFYSNWLDTGTVAVNGEWTVLRSRISPYVSGQLGWTALDTNIYAGSDYGCWWDPWWGYVCAGYDTSYGKDVASWSLGAGVRVEVTPEVFMRIGYDHAWMDLDSYEGSDMFRVDIGTLY